MIDYAAAIASAMADERLRRIVETAPLLTSDQADRVRHMLAAPNSQHVSSLPHAA